MFNYLLNLYQLRVLELYEIKTLYKKSIKQRIFSWFSQSDFERDDDDPLSIRSLSITSLGIIFAILTIFLPSISILIGRPLSQGNEIIHNRDFKKDGP